MAISHSHQWFVQWALPPIVVSDIDKEYDKLDQQWNKPWESLKESSIQATVPPFNPYQVPTKPTFYRQSTSYGKKHSIHPNGNTHVTGLMLWLTTLGIGGAGAQTLAADTDTLPFHTLYKWKTIDFDFPSLRHQRHAIATGKFTPENVIPLGLEVWGSRVWVTLPRWRSGVPATLATVPRAGGLTSPPLKPYPSWGYHGTFSASSSNACETLTSVLRLSADSCGRLWVLDSGQIDLEDEPRQICPPSIFVFNLWNDQLIHRFIIPQNYVLQGSLYSNIVVDTRTEDCSDLHAYIADTWRFGLLVFRMSDQKFWRFSHHLFYPDPLASNYTLHDLNFQWTDGIIGLALSPLKHYEPRTLYFNSMSSYMEFSVSSSILQDESRVNDSANEFQIVGKSRGEFGQVSASAMDRRGVLYQGLVTRDGIGCWDSMKPYTKKWLGLAAKNSDSLVFPNDVKVDQEKRQSVWVLSNMLPYFQARQLNPDAYNFRILTAETAEAARGTICDPDLPRRHQFFLERDIIIP